MQDWPTFALHPEVRLTIIRDMPTLSPELDAEIDALWATALTRRRLFNGRIFCAEIITPGEISGHWSEYRRLTAQIAAPHLFEQLQIRSLAACGLVTGPDGIAVGRREPNSAYQAGLWQLPPAGSVDAKAACPGGASWQAALLNELYEELGILPADVQSIRPLCLIQHPSGVLDFGAQIDTRLDAPTMLARQRTAPDQEYDRMFIAPAAEIPARVAAQDGILVPSATAFMAHAFPIP